MDQEQTTDDINTVAKDDGMSENKPNQLPERLVDHTISSVVVLLKKAWAVYTEKFWKFMGLQLVAILGAAVYMALFVVVFGLAGDRIESGMTVGLIVFFVGFIFMMVLSAISQIATMYLLRPEEERGVLELLRSATTRFWPYVVVIIAVTLFTSLWSLLLVIPGLIMAVFYSMAYFVWFFEDYESTTALKRSRELVSGYWFAVVGRMLALGLLFWVVMIIFSIPGFFMDPESVGGLLWQFVTQVISFAVAPFAMVYFYTMYQDLVRIKGTSHVVEKTKAAWFNMMLIGLSVVAIVGVVFFVGTAMSTLEDTSYDTQIEFDDADFEFDEDELERQLQLLEEQYGDDLEFDIEASLQ